MKTFTAARAARAHHLISAIQASRKWEFHGLQGPRKHPRSDYGPLLPLRYRTDPTFVVDRIIRPARRIADRIEAAEAHR